MPDAAILRKARREGYVVLTHDLDFGELIALSGAELPGIVHGKTTTVTILSIPRATCQGMPPDPVEV
jgi:predicted nuclease of predicted toxin-antitoxin system